MHSAYRESEPLLTVERHFRVFSNRLMLRVATISAVLP